MARRGLAWTSLLAATALAGCAPRDDSIVVEETANLRYVVSGPTAEEAVDELCGGTVEYLDAYTQELKIRLAAPSDAQVTYIWVPAGVEALGACESTPSARGCASDGKTVASIPILEHELVHAVRQLAGPRNERFVEEGLAEFLGGRHLRGRTPSIADLEDAIRDSAEGKPWSASRLAIAGHFLAFVISELGLEIGQLAALAGSGQDLLQEVSSLVGSDVETLRSAYEAHPIQPSIGFRDGSLSCAVAPRVHAFWTNDTFELWDAFGCSDASSFGSSSGDVSQAYVFRVETEGCYALDFMTSKDDTKIWLEECGANISRTNVLLGYGSAVVLEEGDHIVTVQTPGSTGSESFQLRLRLTSTSASECF